jgi:hypothetical protein
MAQCANNQSPDIASEVTGWVADVDDLLVRFQIAIELLTCESGVAPDVKQMMDELRGRIRRLRVEAPNAQSIQTWLRVLSVSARGTARFINLA